MKCPWTWLKKIFKIKAYVTPPFYPFKRARFIFKRKRYKQMKPQFPSEFVYDIDWYKDWDKNLMEQGWTIKELKQGWRWSK